MLFTSVKPELAFFSIALPMTLDVLSTADLIPGTARLSIAVPREVATAEAPIIKFLSGKAERGGIVPFWLAILKDLNSFIREERKIHVFIYPGLVSVNKCNSVAAYIPPSDIRSIEPRFGEDAELVT